MKRSALIVSLCIIFFAGCDIQTESGPFSTLTIAPPLNPYQTSGQTQSPGTATLPASTAEPLIPSPTPFKHIIRSGETLYGIALQYNISLDRLVSANPGLDSRMLIVGTEVIIPLGDDDNQLPIPTPYPLLVGDPVCFPTAEEELWCYTWVGNNQSFPLENISIALNIHDGDQDLIRSRIAYLPLDRLFPGQNLPIGDLITDPPDNPSRISATLLTAYPSDRIESNVLISDYSLEYSQEDTIVHVSGFFELIPGGLEVDQVWIAGAGYNQGDPVALRKWISPEQLESEVLYPFEFILYSLGPPIDQVQVFGEAH